MPSAGAWPLGAGVLLVPLLRRMRTEFEATGTLSRPTAVAMWCAYGAGAAEFAAAARRANAAAAVVAGAAGVALLVGGMDAFERPGELTGTRTGPLLTGGLYRYSRNPQYTGLVLLAAAIALAVRSRRAAGLTALLAAVYRLWVPAEERALERAFGDAYRHYAANTPRWIGPPTRPSGRQPTSRTMPNLSS